MHRVRHLMGSFDARSAWNKAKNAAMSLFSPIDVIQFELLVTHYKEHRGQPITHSNLPGHIANWNNKNARVASNINDGLLKAYVESNIKPGVAMWEEASR